MRFFKNILIIILLFLYYKGNGQPQLNDSSTATEYWAKRGIIEMVYAFMNDYLATVTDSILPKHKIKQYKNEKIGLDLYKNSFIDNINKKKPEEINSDLNSISQFLISNNWSGAEKNLFKPLMENYKKIKSLDRSFFYTTKPSSTINSLTIPGYENKMVKWNSELDSITLKYTKCLETISSNTKNTRKKIDSIQTDTSSNVVPKKELPQKEKNAKAIWIIISITCVLSILFGGSLVYFYSRVSIYKIMDDDLNTYLDEVQMHDDNFTFKYIKIVKLLRDRKNVHKREKETYIDEIKKFKKEVSNISIISPSNNNEQSTLEELEVPVTSLEEPKQIIEWEINQKPKTKGCLYFSIPESDGHFIIEKGDSENSGRKFYKIEFKFNSDHGELFFISSDQDKRAINNLDAYLKPVCDIENITNAEFSNKIKIISPGKVIQISDSWVIDPDHKIKIKLV